MEEGLGVMVLRLANMDLLVRTDYSEILLKLGYFYRVNI